MDAFASDLRRFTSRTMNEIRDLKRAVAIALFTSIVMDCPVLTGRLRANWRFSLNRPNYDVTDNTDPTGSLAVQLMNSAFSSSNADDELIATNSLPYAHRIEYDGWSHTKAPEGMVRKNVIRFRRILAEQLKS